MTRRADLAPFLVSGEARWTCETALDHVQPFLILHARRQTHGYNSPTHNISFFHRHCNFCSSFAKFTMALKRINKELTDLGR